jgi:hypothetical protein
MIRWILPSLIFPVCLSSACGSDSSEASQKARDLQLALQPAAPAAPDTASQRADSQFQECAYVYDSEEKLRECLVLRQGWSPLNAARRIATYKADLAKAVDSVNRVMAAQEVAAAQRADSIRRAAGRRADSIWRSRPHWVGSTRNHRYYRFEESCWTGWHLPVSERVFFWSEQAAIDSGYRDIAERGCYTEPD